MRRVAGAQPRDHRLFALVHVARQVDAGARVALADRVDEDRSPRAQEDVAVAGIGQRAALQQRRRRERQERGALGDLGERANLRVSTVAGDDERRQDRSARGHDADDALLIAHELGHALALAQLDARFARHARAQRVDERVVIDGEAVRPRSADFVVRQPRRLAARLHAGEATHFGAARGLQRVPEAARLQHVDAVRMNQLAVEARILARARLEHEDFAVAVSQRRRHRATGKPAADDDDVVTRRVLNLHRKARVHAALRSRNGRAMMSGDGECPGIQGQLP